MKNNITNIMAMSNVIARTTTSKRTMDSVGLMMRLSPLKKQKQDKGYR